MNKHIWIVIVFVFTQALFLNAQQRPNTDQQKIGLVLSGGGAKGLAHIGTLKVIDSLGIKIDYVAGTSMGAIVGSLYASGYTGQQLDSIFQTIDFDEIISDDIPRESKTYFERKDNERYGVTLPFKDFKIQVPNSLSKGQNIYNLLSRLLSHVKDVNEFNELPIPFFCVATDVETGEDIILDNGYLPRAVNASGALPSLFAPVEIENRLLIDGGVTDNYPVEKLRERGMDIIIGVDVQDGLKNRDQLNGAFDILTQINNYRTINAMQEKVGYTDVYIDPDIENYTVISFDQGKAIIKEGEIAAFKKLDQLQKLVEKGGYQRKKLPAVTTDSIYLAQVYINGNENYSRAYINGRFKIETPGNVAYDDIRDGINNLQATNNFSKINYEIINTPDGAVLEIGVIETTVRNYLRLGVHYDELLRSAALVNLTRKNVLFDSDVVSADVILGDNVRYNFDYYIDKGKYWSIGLHSEFVQYEKQISANFLEQVADINIDVNSIDLDYNDWTQQLYLQTKIGNGFNLTVGAEYKSLRLFTETLGTDVNTDERTIFENSNYSSVYTSVLYDTYDNLFFPSSGWKIDGDLHIYLYNNGTLENNFQEFSMAQISVGHARKFGNWSLRGDLLLGLPIGNPGNSSFDFYLGGYGARRINNILPFYGYDFVSLSGNTVMQGLIEIDYEIFKNNHIILSTNSVKIEDYLFEKSDWLSTDGFTGYAIGYGLETFLGPLELKYSFSPEQSKGEFYVNLGFQF
ncbi:patatin-like phospholipase family protein [Nonlabens mediterrranea]|uniref:Patatin-like phospholipase family protein n=1 Tax=Nonlabens mediterrranea TaxID=1419947 RepID=A0ABS0A1U7_9FLAO|nr:patatin-like phospholipase family protein [Nonlabens mediterrranea]